MNIEEFILRSIAEIHVWLVIGGGLLALAILSALGGGGRGKS